jgi:hypothetical protein
MFLQYPRKKKIRPELEIDRERERERERIPAIRVTTFLLTIFYDRLFFSPDYYLNDVSVSYWVN